MTLQSAECGLIAVGCIRVAMHQQERRQLVPYFLAYPLSDSHSNTVPVQLLNGATIKFEVNQAGREDVSFDAKQFQPVADAIKGVVQMIATPIQKARPKKATVKFGM